LDFDATKASVTDVRKRTHDLGVELAILNRCEESFRRAIATWSAATEERLAGSQQFKADKMDAINLQQQQTAEITQKLEAGQKSLEESAVRLKALEVKIQQFAVAAN
jgi:hypothetical protein